MSTNHHALSQVAAVSTPHAVLTPIPSAHADDQVTDADWQAICSRDKSADIHFVYAVTTTGIYCRPSCPSRRALRQHVQIFHAQTDAIAAGFRPCKRCTPDQLSNDARHLKAVTAACRMIEEAETEPSLEMLAQSQGMSRFHFHRLFKQHIGVTPKAYAQAHRQARVRTTLKQSHTITSALYDAGYESNSPFYAQSKAQLGMTPTAYRRGGEALEIQFAIGECSLGAILVARTTRGLCAIFLGEEPEQLIRDLEQQFPRATLSAPNDEFNAWVAQVIGWVDHPTIPLALPLDIRGTAFQQQVWQALQAIPLGTTLSYSELAARLGMPKASRAIASACAANTLAIAIPCHRIIRKGGDLSGYRWGVARKQALLDREAEQIQTAEPRHAKQS